MGKTEKNDPNGHGNQQGYIDGLLDEVSKLKQEVNQLNIAIEQQRDYFRNKIVDYYLDHLGRIENALPWDVAKEYIHHFGSNQIEIQRRKHQRNNKKSPDNSHRPDPSIFGGEFRRFKNMEEFKSFFAERHPEIKLQVINQIDEFIKNSGGPEKITSDSKQDDINKTILKGMADLSRSVVSICEEMNALRNDINDLKGRRGW